MSEVQNQSYEEVAIELLHPHPQNPRQGDFGAIYESIKENGFYGTLIVQRLKDEQGEPSGEGLILAGNHRFEAAKQLGYEKVPVAWVDVDESHQKRILLADNRTNDLADYDQNELATLLKAIHEDSGDLAGTGYDEDDLDQLIADLEFEEIGKLEGTEERQWDPEERYENQYMSTDLRQIIIVMHKDEYAWALGVLKEMHDAEENVETNTHAILLLLKRWKEEHGAEGEANGDEGTYGTEEAAAPDSLGGL